MAPLNIFILVTGLIVVLGMLFWHNRKRSNRHPEEFRQADGSGGNKIDPETVRGNS